MKIKSTDNILIERGVTSNRAVVHRTDDSFEAFKERAVSANMWWNNLETFSD